MVQGNSEKMVALENNLPGLLLVIFLQFLSAMVSSYSSSFRIKIPF